MEKLGLYLEGYCSVSSIRGDLPHRLWDGSTADGGTNLLGTRIVHNKIVTEGTDLVRCYVSYIDPFFIASLAGSLAVVLIIAGFVMLKKKLLLLYLPFSLFPVLMLFHQPSRIAAILNYYRVFIYGLCAIILGVILYKIISSWGKRYKHE